jgi:hypothetical protein
MSTPCRYVLGPFQRPVSKVARTGSVAAGLGLLVGALWAGPAAAASGAAGDKTSGSMGTVVMVGAILCLIGLARATFVVASRNRARLRGGMTRVTAVSTVGGTAVKRATSTGAGVTARRLGTSFEWTRTNGRRVAGSTKRVSSSAYQATAQQVGTRRERAGQAEPEPADETPKPRPAATQAPPAKAAAPKPKPAPAVKAARAAEVAEPAAKPKAPRLVVAEDPEPAVADDAPAAPETAVVETADPAPAPEAPAAAAAAEPVEGEEPSAAATSKSSRAGGSKQSGSSKPRSAGASGKPGSNRPARKRQKRRNRRH